MTTAYSETAMFETGAGIGASKGKEVGKYSGYSGYVAMAKDSVRPCPSLPALSAADWQQVRDRYNT